MCLAQRIHFLQDVFQMTTIALMTHLSSSSEVVNHPDSLFFTMAPLWAQQWIVDRSRTSCPSRTLRDKKKNLGDSDWMNAETTQVRSTSWSADWGIDGRATPFVDCMWSCHILLEPLHIFIPITTSSKYPPELVQLINITLLCDRDCLLVCLFKPKRSDYSMFWYGHLGSAFHKVQGLLKHLICTFYSPVHTVIAIDMSTEPDMCFVAKPNTIKKVRILFNIVLE